MLLTVYYVRVTERPQRKEVNGQSETFKFIDFKGGAFLGLNGFNS